MLPLLWGRIDLGARGASGCKGGRPLAKVSLARHQFEEHHMRSKRVSGDSAGIRGEVWIFACCVLAAMCSVIHAGDGRRRATTLVPQEVFEGKELFEKSWEPGKPSPTGGDGLGPLYNEESCVACHNLGGTGGGGARDRDVIMLTAITGSGPAPSGRAVYHGELDDLHPGCQNRASIVLHRRAIDPAVRKRLGEIRKFDMVETREGLKVLRRGSRNTPALFGAGLIDAIPDTVLFQAARRSFRDFPEIKGRVSALPDGQLGRFGWKGQISSLDDFVRAACSNELGLEVPGHHQATFAAAREFDPSTAKFDMDEEQCRSMTAFLAHLAPPLQRSPDGHTLPPWGYMVFESIGCATCHAPTLGVVSGIYSDLLLHDIGESSSDSATYYGAPIAPTRSLRNVVDAREPTPRSGMADATEWRTPPLWRVADSAPYLHNGRAATLDEAIRRHGGEAARTADRYSRLEPGARNAVLLFLSSLKISAERRKPAGSPRKRSMG
jgi:CxxC motif-containing protein (DUF1111 family)